MQIDRRRFLTTSGALAAGGWAVPSLAAAEASADPSGRRPKHIIQLVSDGMSMGTLTGADHLSQLLRERGLTWVGLHRNPDARFGLMNMRSWDSLVTDSSAASSSWGSGSRIRNGAVNVLPDGQVLKPLYSVLGEEGWKRGLVTTTEITHATPAGFAANDRSRNSAERIAAQYLDRQIDVLLGGGRKFFDPNQREDGRDLWAEFNDAGYSVMKTRQDLLDAPRGPRWLGTFSEGHLPFSLDQMENAELQTGIPTLAEMTRAALGWLGNRPERFILQIEGGRVDHACHNCDAAGAFHDQIAFDEALDVCLEFQRNEPDTLLVITTDHGNGNPGLNGTGSNYRESNSHFANLRHVRASFAEIFTQLGASPSARDIVQTLDQTTGFRPPLEKAEMLARFLNGSSSALYSGMNSASAQLGQLLGNYLGIGWTSNAHTADYVPILALGPGAEKFQGFIENTEVFSRYMEFAGLNFQNPKVPLPTTLEATAELSEPVEEYMLA